MNTLNDRRQAALEAFWDEYTQPFQPRAAEVAVETATRVRITPEIIAAYRAARAALDQEQMHGRPLADPDTITTAGLIAAFRAAGFEVEE